MIVMLFLSKWENEEETMNKHTTIGFDIAKQVFHLMKIDRSGAELQRKKLRRS